MPGIVEAIEPGVPMTKGSSGCFCSLFPGAYERNLGLRQGFFDIRRKRITQSLSECLSQRGTYSIVVLINNAVANMALSQILHCGQ